MPLANDCSFVARFLQQLRKCLLRPIKPISVSHKTVQVAVLSGLNDGTAWPANAVCAEAVGKKPPLVGNAIQVRRLVDPGSVRTNGMSRVVVREDKNNIRTLVVGSRSRGSGENVTAKYNSKNCETVHGGLRECDRSSESNSPHLRLQLANQVVDDEAEILIHFTLRTFFMLNRRLFLSLSFVTCVWMTNLTTSYSQDSWIPLWPEGAPSANGTAEQDVPAVLFRPSPTVSKSAPGIVVCPGGGYGGLAMGHEGYEIADWLNQRGIHAWILRYRLGSKGYHHPVQRGDVLRAMRVARTTAMQSPEIDEDRIGVWGFSAGGHLASTAATHFDRGNQDSTDAIDRVTCRPDFAILCYPVITMSDDFTHKGSRRNLFGQKRYDDAALVQELSNQNRVTADTPPTFLFHTSEDKVVPVENAIAFYSACRQNGVTAELHVYQKGRHGVGLAGSDPILMSWPDRLHDWLLTNRFAGKHNAESQRD